MVRIDSTRSVSKARSAESARKTSPKRRAASKDNASFAQSLSQTAAADAVEELEAQAAASESAGDIGLLALQERGDLPNDFERARKRAVAYGEGLIERLQALHVRLLSGVVSEAELLRLQGYFAEDGNGGGAAVEDEKLRSILDEIELRVQVELAKKRR